MPERLKYLIVTVIAAISVTVSAQNNQVIYYMRLPQNRLMNPAIKPSTRIYIGLPVLTGISAGLDNNFLEIGTLFTSGENISNWPPADFNLEKFASSLNERNSLSVGGNFQLFGLSFMAGKDLNIFLDVIDRVEFNSVIPRSILEMIINGPDSYANKTLDLSDLTFRAQYFREYSMGFSRNFGEKFRAGARVKALFGMASMNFDNRSFLLDINNDLTATIDANASLNISGQSQINLLKDDLSSGGSKSKFFTDFMKVNTSNMGFGIDLGAVYDLNKVFSFSASITDLGYINWKDDLRSYESSDPVTFDVLSLKEVVENSVTMDSLFNRIQNAVVDAFPENPDPAPFKTYLPTTISLGANMNLLKGFSIGALSSSRMMRVPL
jgi:hypothetical protein